MSDFRLDAIKEFIAALFNDPRCLQEEDNVLYCEKLFKVNDIMNKVYDRLASGDMNIREMKLYLSYIDEYLNDEADLNWDIEGLSKQPKEE
mgnify:CR=1 FL=1|tara:strand:- start:504 stop:776 length:273 start_codon:yes stop_codon:yes gene_type:complete